MNCNPYCMPPACPGWARARAAGHVCTCSCVSIWAPSLPRPRHFAWLAGTSDHVTFAQQLLHLSNQARPLCLGSQAISQLRFIASFAHSGSTSVLPADLSRHQPWARSRGEHLASTSISVCVATCGAGTAPSSGWPELQRGARVKHQCAPCWRSNSALDAAQRPEPSAPSGRPASKLGSVTNQSWFS